MSKQAIEPFEPSRAAEPGSVAWAWALLRAASEHARTAPVDETASFAAGAGGRLRAVPEGSAGAVLSRRSGAWLPVGAPPAAALALLDLYLPICTASPASPLTVGHLGQSLDGYIATRSGDSSYVNSPENILHLHRLRALCDAVIVGAGTVAADDPRLTARLADGNNPVRVILDPRRRLSLRHRVFTDGEAPSLLVCDAHAARTRGPEPIEVVGMPCVARQIDLAALLETLHARGLYSVFVEGGGTTVSRFLEAGRLDRLQIAIAPLVIGRGRPGLRLPANERIAECLRPAHRVFAMDGDVLFDCDMRSAAAPRSDTGVERVC